MEMNFPHKELAQIDHSDVIDEAGLADAILTHAISRQSLGFSVRNFVSHKNEVAGAAMNAGSGWMENRIRYFAEGVVEGSMGIEANNFVRGHFRPDLALGCSVLDIREGESA